MENKIWFTRAMSEVRNLFSSHGYTVPEVQVTFGFTSKGLRSSTIGECWATRVSDSKINHIFISPTIVDSEEILSTLIHECIHAIDDCQHGHGKEFKSIALKIGFKGPMRSTPPGPELKDRISKMIKKIGTYDAPRITVSHKPRINKQPTRARCSECGYTVSVLSDFVHQGPPICPEHGIVLRKIGKWG